MNDETLNLLRLLLARLERISTDSLWAHRASGVRGALLSTIDQLENGQQIESPKLKRLVAYGFQILAEAARERL